MRKIKTREPIEELQEILLDMNIFDDVKVDSLTPLPAFKGNKEAYIIIDGDVQEENGIITDSIEGYDRELIINIHINLNTNTQDTLYHLDLRDDVEDKIINDSKLWEVVIDRNILGSSWEITDANGLKTGRIICVLKFRSCTI